MTYANFKTTVLSYLNRAAATFTSGSLDYVLAAMNDARRAAQRGYTFNLARRPAFVDVSLVGKSLLTDFKSAPSGSTTVVVKQIDDIYEYSSTTVGSTTAYYRTAMIPYRRISQFQLGELPQSTSVDGSIDIADTTTDSISGFCYIQGTTLYHSTLATATWVMCDVVEMIADHDGGSSEDIFLTYFVDWLKYATLLNLNQFLKDSERFPIDAQFMQTLWDSVKQYDAQQSAASGAISLD
jgi:hypothetical protein